MYLRGMGRQLAVWAVALTVVSCASAGTPPRQQGATALEEAAPPSSRAISGVRYEVTFDSTTAAARALRVRMTFRTDPAQSGPVILAFPRWTPGAYELGEFAEWASAFSAEAGGSPLPWARTGPETWSIWP